MPDTRYHLPVPYRALVFRTLSSFTSTHQYDIQKNCTPQSYRDNTYLVPGTWYSTQYLVLYIKRHTVTLLLYPMQYLSEHYCVSVSHPYHPPSGTPGRLTHQISLGAVREDRGASTQHPLKLLPVEHELLSQPSGLPGHVVQAEIKQLRKRELKLNNKSENWKESA